MKVPENQNRKKNKNLHHFYLPSSYCSSQKNRKLVCKHEISNFKEILTIEGKNVIAYLVELPPCSLFDLYFPIIMKMENGPTICWLIK